MPAFSGKIFFRSFFHAERQPNREKSPPFSLLHPKSRKKKTRSFPFFLPHTQVFAVHMPCVGSLKKDGPPPPEKIFLLCPVMQRKRHGRAQMPDRQRAEILTRPFPGRSEGAQNMPQKCMFRFSSHSLLPGSEVSQNNGPRRTKGSGCSVCDSRAFSPRPSILAAHCLMYALRIIFHGLPRRRRKAGTGRQQALMRIRAAGKAPSCQKAHEPCGTPFPSPAELPRACPRRLMPYFPDGGTCAA